jgi:hypothetical protein
MNANQKKSAGQIDDAWKAEQKPADPASSSEGQPGMATVPETELNKVEGGYGLGTRTGEPTNFFRKR